MFGNHSLEILYSKQCLDYSVKNMNEWRFTSTNSYTDNGSQILKVRRCGLGSSGSGLGTMAISFEDGNEVSNFIRVRVFPEYLVAYWLLKNDFVPWC
jgi:hypothetical protein